MESLYFIENYTNKVKNVVKSLRIMSDRWDHTAHASDNSLIEFQGAGGAGGSKTLLKFAWHEESSQKIWK